MLAVATEISGFDTPRLGRPRRLFERRYARVAYNTYSVTPDGQRFVDLEEVEGPPEVTHLVLVQNFDEELKRRVPANE